MRPPRTSRPVRDAALAISLLSIIPSRAEWPEGERPDVAGYFPLVGLAIGGVTAALFAVVITLGPLAETFVQWRASIFGLIVIAAWAAITRMLHWDGLADVADAVWGSHDRQRRLEIMADPATGAFGTVAVVFVMLAQLLAVGSLLSLLTFAPLVLAPVAGRLAASFGAWLGKPARPGGLGAAVTGRPGVVSVLAAVTVTAAAAWLCLATLPFFSAVTIVAVALIAAPVVPHLLSLPFRGVTGDVLGASVLLTETFVLITAALVVW